jgi:myxalamid-type polyketide synthase MxaE and MxaD
VASRGGTAAWSHARLDADGDGYVGQVRLFDEAGDVVAEISGFRVQRVAAATSQAVAIDHADWLYQVAWEPRALAPRAGATDVPGRWLLLADGTGLAERLRERIRELGDEVVLVGRSQDPLDPTGFDRLLAELGPSPWKGVVHLWSLDASPNDDTTLDSLSQAEASGCAAVVHLVQALARRGQPAKLWIVTRGAQPAIAGDSVSVAQAPVWGLGRVVALEHPELWGGAVDLPAVPADAEVGWLLAEFLGSDGEDQVAWRDGQRLVSRLVRAPLRKPSRCVWSRPGPI